MTGFPGSPKVAKGALVGLDPINPLASVVVFQYNPETVTRRLTASTGQVGGSEREQLRLKGPPEETISFEIEIDAVDQLAAGDPTAQRQGIAPVLASLELLLYPKSALVVANAVLSLAGLVEVVPPEVPLALLVWSPTRVLPVRLTDFSITEQAFDQVLNPIQARVSLSLRVLTYDDLGLASAGGALFLAHQIAKEDMATVNGATARGSFSTATAVRIGG
ncbi:MAG TPA: hypothetical protein VFU54_03280 [Actinomycetota bacterium]|jgi:hypothetical protein|nr:hypothetical protein [Actinomycetota bacterium]